MNLSLIDLPGDQKLRLAAQALVEAKDDLDGLLERPAIHALVPGYITTAHGRAVDGWAFARAVVPFLDLGSGGKRYPARLPLDYLIGEPWRSPKSEFYDHDHRVELADYLASDARAGSEAADPAEAVWIPALALGVVREGRNRVQFLRQMEYADMAARVEEVDYPPRDRLALYAVPAPGQPAYWCVKDNRWLQPLPLPAFTLPLLAAYGIPAPKPWPESWPAPEAVRHAIEQVADEPAWRIRIDLPALVRVEETRRAYDVFVPASALDIAGIQVNWRLGGTLVTGWAVLMILALVLPDGGRIALHAGATGILVGIAAGLTGRFLLAMRRRLARYETEG